jgi:ATP-dependent helicase/DNAse subunit B
MAGAIKRTIVDERCDPARIVVSYPQLAEQEREVRNIFSDYGIPIAGPETLYVLHSTAVQAFLSVLDMVQDGFRRDDVLEFIRCPFLRPGGLLKRGADTHPRELSADYIDALTKQAKIQGGGNAGVERFREGFAAIRPSMRKPERTQQNPAAANRRLEHYDEQTGALLEVLENLQARFAKPCAPADFRDACLKLFSDLSIVDQLIITVHNAGNTTRLRAELKALSEFMDTLRDVCRGLVVGGLPEATPAAIYSALQSALNGDQVKTSTRSEGIQLLPMKEAWLVDCDYLFCGGLTESSFPGPVRGDVFLSSSARARLGLSRLDEKVAESKFLIHALLFRPRKGVYLSYPTSVDEQPTLRAACLQEIELVGGDAPVRWEELSLTPNAPCTTDDLQVWLGDRARNRDMDVSDDLLRQSITLMTGGGTNVGDPGPSPRGVIRRLEASIDRGIGASRFSGKLSKAARHVHDILTDEALSKSHGHRVFCLSRSALEDYLSCPFKFLAGRVLRLTPRDDFEPDVAANDLGTLIHEILHLFYESMRQQNGSIHPVTSANLAEARAKIQGTARTCIVRDVNPGLPRRRISSLLLEPDALLDAFLKNEAADEQGWTPVNLEASFGPPERMKRAAENLSPAPLLLQCEAGGQQETVAIYGVIDRLDVRMVNGRRVYRVLDYKTGTTPLPKHLKEGTSLQLPIYVAAVAQILGCEATAGYYVLSQTKEVTIKDYAKGNTLAVAVENLNHVVSSILSGILAGEFMPQPSKDDTRLCSHCDFRTICRSTHAGSSRA